jgi:hypothetical protein
MLARRTGAAVVQAGMSPTGYLFEAPIIFAAQFADVAGSALLEFGVVSFTR